LVDKLRDEQNPKFKNSEFMGLMRSLRDKTLIVEGNQIVAVNESVRTSEFSREFVGPDIKGKGRAVEDFQPRNPQIPFGANHGAFASPLYSQDGSLVGERSGSSLHNNDEQRDAEASSSSVDEVYEYFRQENEEYIQYHNEQYEEQPQVFGAQDHNVAEWDKLQDDWDAFDATSAGIRLSGYQFTPNNPYLVGERSSKTLNHMRHSFAPYEV
jgi:peroxin-5